MSTSDPVNLGFPNHQNYAFLAEHIPDDIPGKDEFGSTNRQKRRRTSPQDQAVLEAAYRQNSKPDKSERMQIVRQVALGEKEVQSEEIKASTPSRTCSSLSKWRSSGSAATFAAGSPMDYEQRAGNTSLPAFTSRDEQQPVSRASSIHELLNSSSSSETKSSFSAPTTQECVELNASLPSSFEQSEDPTRPMGLIAVAGGSSDQDVRIPGARKRAHGEMIDLHDFPMKNPAEEPPKFPPQSSVVRLSMTADGAVKIRTSDQATPSPPKERAPAPDVGSRRTGGLQRSKSAVGSSEMRTETSPLPLNLRAADSKLGRSRDARTWEFYCDSETRDSLSSHAEHERNGSAVGAINLIRSQSQRQLRQMLAPVASRTNSHVPARLESNGQRSKPKLSRAKSSLARLQGVDDEFSKHHAKEPRSPVNRSPSGDSDKENWIPGTQASRNILRKEQAGSTGRPILVENPSSLSQMGGATIRGNRVGTGFDEKENRLPVSVGLKEKGSDLDCVQGLLSLSQGAWR